MPLRVLSRLFRQKFLAYLSEAFNNGALHFHGRLETLAERSNWCRLLAKLGSSNWVVYAKPPFGGPTQVLKYLARYTHRVAISNRRLVPLENGKVTFRWKDYIRGNSSPSLVTATPNNNTIDNTKRANTPSPTSQSLGASIRPTLQTQHPHSGAGNNPQSTPRKIVTSGKHSGYNPLCQVT